MKAICFSQKGKIGIDERRNNIVRPSRPLAQPLCSVSGGYRSIRFVDINGEICGVSRISSCEWIVDIIRGLLGQWVLTPSSVNLSKHPVLEEGKVSLNMQ